MKGFFIIRKIFSLVVCFVMILLLSLFFFYKKIFFLLFCFVMILSLSVFASADTTYVTDGLVARFDGSSFSGSTWTDLSGNGNDITMTIDDTNKFANGAFHLDTLRIDLPTALAAVPQADEWSIEIVFGSFESKGTDYNTVMNSSNDNFALFRRINGDFLEFKNTSNARPKVEGGLDFLANSTITLTYKVGGDCVLYVDGVAVGTTQPAAAVGNVDLYIGHADASRNFAADYKAMRFYSRALTADEVTQNVAADAAGPTDESQDTSVAESTTESTTTPPETGDTSYIAFALVAMVALAGVVVVKRVR